ncbi:MAG: hypothetical protein RJA47_728 [Actinomycetota bacterium]|jgi:hypothetical protein
MNPETARKTWRTAEPIHAFIYFLPEASEAYDALGPIGPRTGYFASRVAAMGEVPADVVVSTFYNFNPGLVRDAMVPAWTVASAEKWAETRLTAVDAGLRRGWNGVVDSPEIRELATLLRDAAMRACESPEGRPLFAGHASLQWPDEPHLQLWLAQTLLREFRGDGHIAALVTEGLSGLEALITHAGSGDVTAKILASSRAWPEAEWNAGVEGLAARGIVNADGSLTEAGRAQRDRIELRTDELAVAPYAVLGEEKCERARELARPLSKAIVDSGMIGFR